MSLPRFVGARLALGLLVGGLVSCTDAPPTPASNPVWPTPYPTPMPAQPVTQSANGYTITLYPLYADPSRAVIRYTIAGPTLPPLAALWLGRSWRDDWLFQGPQAQVSASDTNLPAWSPLPGAVTTDQAPLPADLNATHLWAFDMAPLAPLPAVLPLRITGDLFANLPPKYESVWPYPQEQRLAADVKFDVAIPVNPRRRTAFVQQSVYTANLSLTLEQVAVTASETRFYLQTQPPASDPGVTWRPESMALQIGAWQGQQQDERSYPAQGLGTTVIGHGSWITLYPDSLLERPGDWTLVIPTLIWSEYDVATRVEGPWIFHFQMPAPSNGPLAP